MECPNCGAPARTDAERCEACQKPMVGEAGNAPRGSDNPPPERGARRAWSTAVWGVVVTAVLTAALLAVLAF